MLKPHLSTRGPVSSLPSRGLGDRIRFRNDNLGFIGFKV